MAELASHRTIEVTTYGRRSRQPRRIEIWWFHFDNTFIVTGTPGRRDWLANVRANPRVVVHVGGRDIPAVASEVTDTTFKRRFFETPMARWYSTESELERLVDFAPMVQLDFEE